MSQLEEKPDAPDVESGRPMSAERKVKSVYPDARAWKHRFDDWQVAQGQNPFVSILTYGHKTEADAWEKAASQLPPTEQPQDPLPPLDDHFENMLFRLGLAAQQYTDAYPTCGRTIEEFTEDARKLIEQFVRASLAESASLRTQLSEITALEAQRRDELKSAYDGDRAKGEALGVIATEMKKLRELQRRDELKSAYDGDRAKGEALSVIATEMKKLRELLEAGLAEPREGSNG